MGSTKISDIRGLLLPGLTSLGIFSSLKRYPANTSMTTVTTANTVIDHIGGWIGDNGVGSDDDPVIAAVKTVIDPLNKDLYSPPYLYNPKDASRYIVTPDVVAQHVTKPGDAGINALGKALMVIMQDQFSFSQQDEKDGIITARYYRKHGTLQQWQIDKWLKPDFTVEGPIGVTKTYPRICGYWYQLDCNARNRLMKATKAGVADETEEVRQAYAKAKEVRPTRMGRGYPKKGGFGI